MASKTLPVKEILLIGEKVSQLRGYYRSLQKAFQQMLDADGLTVYQWGTIHGIPSNRRSQLAKFLEGTRVAFSGEVIDAIRTHGPEPVKQLCNAVERIAGDIGQKYASFSMCEEEATDIAFQVMALHAEHCPDWTGEEFGRVFSNHIGGAVVDLVIQRKREGIERIAGAEKISQHILSILTDPAEFARRLERQRQKQEEIREGLRRRGLEIFEILVGEGKPFMTRSSMSRKLEFSETRLSALNLGKGSINSLRETLRVLRHLRDLHEQGEPLTLEGMEAPVKTIDRGGSRGTRRRRVTHTTAESSKKEHQSDPPTPRATNRAASPTPSPHAVSAPLETEPVPVSDPVPEDLQGAKPEAAATLPGVWNLRLFQQIDASADPDTVQLMAFRLLDAICALNALVALPDRERKRVCRILESFQGRDLPGELYAMLRSAMQGVDSETTDMLQSFLMRNTQEK